ncbi:hypothetical protein BDV26DRAFT_188705 [Aspergillus bertholletiae]|uniref:Uncharacterized protein n=1 Tax=Aspergillus bertholletiae TaxID=1226010 RepID=A0A5N7BA18_9EURO|nr:hypothetical protein BDV26DRAFT_188705 [Aspergillus bertholletiae]
MGSFLTLFESSLTTITLTSTYHRIYIPLQSKSAESCLSLSLSIRPLSNTTPYSATSTFPITAILPTIPNETSETRKMPCYHEESPFSQVPARVERRNSVSSLASVSSEDSLVHRPSMSYVNMPDNSLIGFSGHIRTNGNLYICCKCSDGPKLYEIQPQCVICNHYVCQDCVHVK